MLRSRQISGPFVRVRQLFGVAALALALGVGATACGAAGRPAPPSPQPTNQHGSSATATTTPEVSVHGSSVSSDDNAANRIAVGFQEAGCASCRLYSAVTDGNGTYSLTLPPGSYLVVCKASDADQTCSPMTSDGVHADLTSPQTEVDVKVSTGATPPPPPPPTTPDDHGSHADDAPVLSGHVRDAAGRPVSGVAVEIKFVPSGDVWVSTDASGYYAFTGDVRIGTALCVVQNVDYQCSPVGTPAPVTVNPDDGPRTLDWVVTSQ